MSSIHHTKGIVLRTVKYGETSLVVSIYTEMFGLQQYMVNGVRTNKKIPSCIRLSCRQKCTGYGCLSQRQTNIAAD